MMWNIIKLLKNLPRLECLNISNNTNITQEIFSIIKNDFIYLNYLKVLKVNNIELNEKGNNDLIFLMKDMKDLREINLQNTNFNDNNSITLSEISEILKFIEIINLKNNKITVEGYDYLFSKFDSKKCEIYLSGNTIFRVNEDMYNRIVEYDNNYVDVETITELSDNIDRIRKELVKIIEESENLFNEMMILYKENELKRKENLFIIILRILLTCNKFYVVKEKVLSFFNEDEKEYKMINGIIDISTFSYDGI